MNDPAKAQKGIEVFHYGETPELSPSESPIPILNDNEGLQVIDNQAPELARHSIHHDSPQPNETGPISRLKRRKWLWILAIAVTVSIALGGGLGVGLDVHNNPPRRAAATTTTTPVTNGVTGVTEFSCNETSNDKDTYTATSGAVFREECHIAYHEGTPTYNGNDTVQDLTRLTTYSFESCMDTCANYPDSYSTPCNVVSYNANLTYAIARWSANCFLKNARGTPYNYNRGENYGLVGSAYIVRGL